MWSRSQHSWCFPLVFCRPSSSCFQLKLVQGPGLSCHLCTEKQKEELCLWTWKIFFQCMTGYFTMWYCIKTDVTKMCYKIVKNRSQTCSIYWATCSCLNELDKIFIQDANIDLCFVLDVTAVEEGQGGCQGEHHWFLTARNLTKTPAKREESFFSHKLLFVVSVCFPFLEVCRCCGGGRKPEVARPAWLLLITAHAWQSGKNKAERFWLCENLLKTCIHRAGMEGVAQRWKAKKKQRGQNGGLLFNKRDDREQALHPGS